MKNRIRLLCAPSDREALGPVLEQLRARTEESEERIRLTGRIDLLQSIWRETRELSVLLERYYERGYRRNERYTL